ncbi:MAG: ParA family protein [Acidobacteriota bacterium]
MKVFVVTNQKGGVGKTTVALHLAWAAKDLGHRVLVVDLDSQGNASQLLSGDVAINKRRGGASALFQRGGSLDPIVTPGGLALLHGHRYLDGPNFSDAIQQRDALRSLPYDVAVIDTPPSMSDVFVAPFFWADRLVVPITPDPLTVRVRGHASIDDIVAKARVVNPSLVTRFLINRYTRHVRASRTSLAELLLTYDLKQPYLRASGWVSQSTAAGLPVWAYQNLDASKRLRPAPQEIRGQWQIVCRGLIND